MPPFKNENFIAVIDFRPAIIKFMGHLTIGGKKVYLGKQLGGFQQSTAVFSQLSSNGKKELIFELHSSVLCP